jgi:dTDP-glucose pyrophosphorylase
MKKLSLVIMAAGMGSRYGGLKQIDPVDKDGHIIMDFSIHDAVEAGFEKVVFVINQENEEEFKAVIGDRISKKIEVSYAFQKMYDLPDGFEVPEGRVKPWGTGQALLCCANQVPEDCAVINADDFYGSQAFRVVADYMRMHDDDDLYRFSMAGFLLKNTLTDHGYVSRGVCTEDENENLTGIRERTRIEKRDGGAAYSEDDGLTWNPLPENSIVSMNMWGFSNAIFRELEERFPAHLDEILQNNPLKGEYILPSVVNELLSEGRASVKVLKSHDQWYGVTYKADKPVVMQALRKMEEEGRYRF